MSRIELFELYDVLETTTLQKLEVKVEELVRDALKEQSQVFSDDMGVCILPCCHDATVVDDMVIATMPLEVFAEDGNTILGRGSVTVEYVAEDVDVEVLRIAGGVEWEVGR